MHKTITSSVFTNYCIPCLGADVRRICRRNFGRDESKRYNPTNQCSFKISYAAKPPQCVGRCYGKTKIMFNINTYLLKYQN